MQVMVFYRILEVVFRLKWERLWGIMFCNIDFHHWMKPKIQTWLLCVLPFSNKVDHLTKRPPRFHQTVF